MTSSERQNERHTVDILEQQHSFSCLRFQEYTGPGGADSEVDKPVKEEFSVAKWIKSNVPTKKTKFLNHNVEYFTGERIFDFISKANKL